MQRWLGPQPLAPVALQVPLENALRLLAAPFQRKAITPIVEVSDKLPLVWGMVDQIEQVFLNVLVNAWHAMSDGGMVIIQAQNLGDEHVQITFRDTGMGMSAADLVRAFEPFFSTKDDKGTGLGLAICQQIMENHQGTICLESTPGVGTTVILRWLRADTARPVCGSEC